MTKKSRPPKRRTVDLQGLMFAAADKHFGLESLSGSPSVIFEHGSFKEFNTSVANSRKHRDKIERAIERGDLQLVNHDIVEQFSEVHSRFHTLLHLEGVRVPPAVVRIQGQVVPIGQPLPQESALWVKKVSVDETGKLSIHRGRGVSFLIPKAVGELIPKHDGEFYQQFVIPPDDYMRDIRVFVVGDKIIPGYVRRAAKKLTKANYSGLYPPTEEQFVTAEHPGIVEPLEGKLAEKAIEAARRVRTAVINRVKRGRPKFEKQDVFGFGSIDFLLDADGEPVPIEFDTAPEIRDVGDLHDRLVAALSDYLVEKAEAHRIVRIFADAKQPLIRRLMAKLREKLPESRLKIKPTLADTVIKQLGK